jgi:hypothetical protein
MNLIIENIYNQARLNYKKIVLPESDDERVIEAAKIIRDEKIADIITDLPYSTYQDQFSQTLFDVLLLESYCVPQPTTDN